MSQSESLIDRARFAVENPDVLHTPAMYREIIAGLMEQNDGLLAELELIANSPESPWGSFPIPSKFQDWAQGRARAAVANVKGAANTNHQPISSTADAIEAGFPAL